MPNVTMSIDDDLLKKARKVAVERDTTLTGLIRTYLEDLVRKDDILRERAASELEDLFAKSKAVVGPKTWTRDDLYVRG
jgi:hypothetical protein